MEEEEEESRALGGGSGGGGTTTTTAMTTMMATEMATDRSGGGGTGERGVGLLPGIDKNGDDSNMKARKREANRANTEAKAKTKTGVGGKVGGLDAYMGCSTNFLAGRRFGIYVDF